MAQATPLKVISALSVENGETVYLTSCDAWTSEVQIAELLEQDDHDWRLAFANRLREVEGAGLVDARANEHGLAVLAA